MMVWVKGEYLPVEMTRVFSRGQRFYFDHGVKNWSVGTALDTTFPDSKLCMQLVSIWVGK